MLLGNFKRRSYQRNRQQGYLLIVLMIMVALLAMAALATGPSMATQIKRDRELELVHRGAQYSRAIKKFYKKFGRYPVSLDQLEKANNMRFLRRRYKDPITGKDFRLLHFGEVKLTPKSPGSSTGPGVAPGSGTTGQSSGFASQGQNPIATSAGGTAANLSTFGGTTGVGNPGTNASSPSQPAGGGLNFGGGPIIGVTSTSEKESLMEFNDKNHYNQWEFIYDPTLDRGGLITGPYVPSQAGMGGTVPGGMVPSVTPQAGSGINSPLGQQPGQSSFGQTPQNQQSPK